jgi:hypothetical protein
MKKPIQLLTIAAIAALFTTATSFAQSSGNFTSRVQTTQCTMNTVPGSLTAGGLNNNGGGQLLSTTIKTPNSSFTTLLIRPSLVTGLFTNTEVTQAMTTSAQTAAVTVKVMLDGAPVAPATTASPSIIYDQRFQQLSAPFFTQLAECTASQNCSMDLIISTLAAHSFDFVAPNVGGGTHALQVSWEFTCSDPVTGAMSPANCSQTYTANTAGACAGPGTVTVQQVKAFSQSGGVVIGS